MAAECSKKNKNHSRYVKKERIQCRDLVVGQEGSEDLRGKKEENNVNQILGIVGSN